MLVNTVKESALFLIKSSTFLITANRTFQAHQPDHPGKKENNKERRRAELRAAQLRISIAGSKFDNLELLLVKQQKIRSCCVQVFAETCPHHNNNIVALNAQTADRCWTPAEGWETDSDLHQRCLVLKRVKVDGHVIAKY